MACDDTTEAAKADQESPNKVLTLEQSILDTMNENDIRYDTIINYDIKGNFIIVVYREIAMQNLNVSMLKQTEDGLEIVLNESISTQGTTVLGSEHTPIITIVKSNEQVKDVTVLGEPAKAVSHNNNPIENISLELTYWIAYTNQIPDDENDIQITYE